MSVACSACGHENREGRKFCGQCGASLAPRALACPGCGSENGPGERFCGECGASLTAPFPVVGEPVGERKQLTVLFADVRGSMELSEELDVEVWAKIVDRFTGILTEEVRRFGGTVDKFTGDGIMALFGAPLALEDHAKRACHAAWAISRAIRVLGEELRRSDGVDLRVRVGINSGEVVVGRVSADLGIDPTALGHAVGLAQRMEALAEPGSAYLTEHTARLVEGWFRLRDLGPMTIKGAREPLRVYVLEGPAPPRGATGGRGARSRLVGRAVEMAVLEDALARADEGQAQVVGVVGEPGVGKSRLCDEFVASAIARGLTVRRATGVSHGREAPLLPILAFLRDYFGITESSSPSGARECIGDRLLGLDPEFEPDLPLMFDLLEVPDPQRPLERMTAEMRMRRIFEVIRRITARRSERELVVFVFEDLHWFDPQSADFLARLIEGFPGSRSLVVANFRPEFSANWMRHSYYRQVPLLPLSADAVAEMLTDMLGADPSLAPLPAYLVERTGGNPFFVEEVVRALVEDGTLDGRRGAYQLTCPLEQVGLPTSVHSVLAARIDRLAAEYKPVLQSAAVIGRTFTEAVLAKVMGQVADVLAEALSTLCAAEMLQETQQFPLAEYRFWHPLTQEVAYRSLLSDRRAALHRAVAEAIIALDPDRLDEQAALIATHFELSGDRYEAARWNSRAADYAFRSDVGESIRRCRATLEHLASAPETADALRLGIQTRQRLIRYGARTGMGLDDAGRFYADAKAVAEKLGDPTLLASITFAYGTTAFNHGAIRETADLWQRAAQFADESDDAEAQAAYAVGAGSIVRWTGPVAVGLETFAEIKARCGGDWNFGAGLLGYSPLSLVAVIGADLLFLAGRVDEARVALDEFTTGGRRLADAELMIWARAMYPRIARNAGEFEASCAGAEEAVRSAETAGNTWFLVIALEGLAVAEIGLGHFPDAAEHLERALNEARQHQTGLLDEARILAGLAQARLGLGDTDGARLAATEAVDVARRQGARIIECFALLTRAEVTRTASGAPDTARADLDAALALATDTGAVAYASLIHEALGRLSSDHDELSQARPLQVEG
jgi:class 3 adenylate cyclase/tetratricopeptide (TPR) repeat protein